VSALALLAYRCLLKNGPKVSSVLKLGAMPYDQEFVAQYLSALLHVAGEAASDSEAESLQGSEDTMQSDNDCLYTRHALTSATL
jgi:hypothetical protein